MKLLLVSTDLTAVLKCWWMVVFNFRGQSPGEAENEYLSNANKLSLYGVHMHKAKVG